MKGAPESLPGPEVSRGPVGLGAMGAVRPHVAADLAAPVAVARPWHVRVLGALRALAWILPLGLLVLAALAGPWVWPELLPRSWSGRAPEAFARQWPRIGTSLLSSLGICVAATVLALAASLPAARYLARRRQPLLEALLLLPALFPPLAFAWGLQGSLATFGLADTAPGLVLALAVLVFPYVLRGLLEAYGLVPPALLECATNLGAGPRFAYVHVELPMVLPGMVSGTVLAFVAAWSDYLLWFMVGGGVVPGYTLFLYPFLLSSDRAMGAFGVLVFLLVPLLLAFVSERLMRSRARRLGLGSKKGGLRV